MTLKTVTLDCFGPEAKIYSVSCEYQSTTKAGAPCWKKEVILYQMESRARRAYEVRKALDNRYRKVSLRLEVLFLGKD